MRAPLSSLAPAALSQAKRGVALAERLPPGIRGRDDLPMLRRVLRRAEQAMLNGPASEQSGSDDESAHLLRTGHQVVRQTGSTVSPSTATPALYPYSGRDRAGVDLALGAGMPPTSASAADVPVCDQASASQTQSDPNVGERRLPETLEEAIAVAESFPGPELDLELDPLIFHVAQDDFGRCVDDELEACELVHMGINESS